MRDKEYLAAIRALNDVLVLNTMYFADEVRAPRDTVGRLPSRRELPKGSSTRRSSSSAS